MMLSEAVLSAGKAALSVRILAMLVLLNSAAALAHDSKRPDLNSWFQGLHSEIGGPCCSDADGALVRDADWETFKGTDGISHYRVRIEGKWIDVPDGSVIRQPNLYGQTIVWGSRSWYQAEGTFQIRCFIAGVMM